MKALSQAFLGAKCWILFLLGILGQNRIYPTHETRGRFLELYQVSQKVFDIENLFEWELPAIHIGQALSDMRRYTALIDTFLSMRGKWK